MRIKRKCDGCNRKVHQLFHRGDKYLCKMCIKDVDIIIPENKSKASKTLNQVLNKVYKANSYFKKNGSVYCTISFPSIMYGKKFKIVLVDE